VVATPLGAFGVVWGARGIRRTWMHARTEAATRTGIGRAYPDAVEAPPPPSVAATLAETAALLGGQARDLRSAVLDMDAIPAFDRRVYEVARTIQPGLTMTYGEVAAALGEEPMVARDVGQALSRDPFAPIVPCHRVVAAGGRLGGYSAPGGADTKRRLLELEGASVVAPAVRQPGLFDPL
jgi:methylated-DNA-[protein]-cysteine S-methyltransferase